MIAIIHYVFFTQLLKSSFSIVLLVLLTLHGKFFPPTNNFVRKPVYLSTTIVTEFIFKGLEADGDQMLPVFSLLNAIFRIKSCFGLCVVFHFQLKSINLGF